MNERQKLIAQKNENPILNEQFNTIRTSIEFSGIYKKFKTLLVTSPESGSGKSVISANLAIVFAQKGLKTLLIDADMRKPTVHQTFNKKKSIGLSNILSEERDIISICHSTDVENLFVLTSGEIPPNPNELLGTSRMKVILKTLKENFDQIIIDTPPVLVVSDALVLAPNTDGIVLVIRDRTTLKVRAKQALQQIRMTKTPIIGSILNGIIESNNNNYYYNSDEEGENYEK